MGTNQELETMISEEALLLVMFPRNEKKDWIPRVAVRTSWHLFGHGRNTALQKSTPETYANLMLNVFEIACLSKILVEAVSDYFLWLLSFTYFF